MKWWVTLIILAMLAGSFAAGIWFSQKFIGRASPVEVDRLIDPPKPCTHNGVPGTLGYREGKLWCFVTHPPAGK